MDAAIAVCPDKTRPRHPLSPGAPAKSAPTVDRERLAPVPSLGSISIRHCQRWTLERWGALSVRCANASGPPSTTRTSKEQPAESPWKTCWPSPEQRKSKLTYSSNRLRFVRRGLLILATSQRKGSITGRITVEDLLAIARAAKIKVSA